MRSVLVIRHVPHEDLGTLEQSLTAAGLSWRYADVYKGAAVDAAGPELAGLIVLGGPMNVDETDKFPFLRYSLAAIEQALAAQRPILGICLGSQLLAKALGAEVRPLGVQEIGWYDLQLTRAAADDALFAGLSPEQRVFQWHGDTFDLPAGGVHLAASSACPQQAFRYGPNAYGLQFHVEVTGENIAAWLKAPDNVGQLQALGTIDAEAIRRQLPDELPALNALGRQVGDRFAGLCRDA